MTKLRALVKATSWRILGSAGTVLTAWWLSGEFRLAAAIGGIEFVLKIGMFYLHERLWERIIPTAPGPEIIQRNTTSARKAA